MVGTTFGKAPSGDGLCVVGNLTVDVIFRGVTGMPEWGQEVLCSSRSEAVAGQGGGLALAAARLGVRTEMIATVGEDATGQNIRTVLKRAGVGIDAVSTVAGGKTAMTIAIVRPDGERAFLSDLGCLAELDSTALAVRWAIAREAAVVALVGTSNLPGLDLDEAASLLREARRGGALTVFDPGWDPEGWPTETVEGCRTVLAETELFLPNVDEARALTQKTDIADVLRTLGGFCPGVVVVKCGAIGSYCVDDGEFLVVEALPVEVDNAVGAGDVYNAGMIASYLKGGNVLDAMSLATAGASFYVSRSSDRFPTFGESAALATRVEARSAGLLASRAGPLQPPRKQQ
jgi:ribokinase